MIFTAGLGVPEGPVLLPDGNFLVVEMAPNRGCVSEISADGTTIKMVAQTGRPNGLAVDATGNVWVVETLEPSLAITEYLLRGTYELAQVVGNSPATSPAGETLR